VMSHKRKDERGFALALVLIFAIVLVMFTALGIDVARLTFTATEVQSVADSSARGGAMALMKNGGTANTGITRAKDIAVLNIMNGAASVRNDVVVDEGFYNFGTNKFE